MTVALLLKDPHQVAIEPLSQRDISRAEEDVLRREFRMLLVTLRAEVSSRLQECRTRMGIGGVPQQRIAAWVGARVDLHHGPLLLPRPY